MTGASTAMRLGLSRDGAAGGRTATLAEIAAGCGTAREVTGAGAGRPGRHSMIRNSDVIDSGEASVFGNEIKEGARTGVSSKAMTSQKAKSEMEESSALARKAGAPGTSGKGDCCSSTLCGAAEISSGSGR